MKTFKTALILASILASLAIAQDKQHQPGVGLTIYNDNFAVVRENRMMNFSQGLNTVKFTEVASAIDPTTMKFLCLSAPGKVQILEQNYEYDLVNKSALLKRYIDKAVTISVKGSGSDPSTTVSGILSAYIGGDIILKKPQDTSLMVISDSSVDYIALAQAPEDLVTKPTLVWLTNSAVEGSQLAQVTYTTESIQWKADYTAVLSADDNMIDLSGWVTINNNSGASYKDASIKLMAGDVRRITQPQYPQRVYKNMVMMVEDERAGGFQEKAFAEYHLYTLGRKSTINNNQVKQIELITPASDIPAVKKFIYDHQKNANKVQVKIEFENLEEYGLGIAMPKGKVRVFKNDPADDSLEFIGEDIIDHTPNKEKLSLYIGDAFDIVPEYKMLESQLGPNRGDYRWRKEKHQVELRNRKQEDIIVYVDHKFHSWPNWKIDDSTHKYEKTDASTARFEVSIKADSIETLTFSTTQSW